MIPHEPGLRVQVVWFDEDVLDLEISASNGLFSGQTRVYTGREGIKELARLVKGFPQSPDERRLIEIGTFDPGFAGGGARLGLRCTDRAGHVALDVLLATQVENHRHQRVECCLEVEPAALDSFFSQIDRLEIRKDASVVLKCCNR